MLRRRSGVRASQRGARSQDGASRPAVLVADDDRMVRELLTAGLEREGYRVLAVADGHAALQTARSSDPVAVVLDWLMPGIQGPDLCAQLKSDPATAGLPVLLLTSRSQDVEVERGFENGADEYVTKPFHLSEVTKVVNIMVAGSRSPGPPLRAERGQGA